MKKNFVLSLVAAAVCVALNTPSHASSFQAETLEDSVVKVKVYESLQEAFDAVRNKGTVTVTEDIIQGKGTIARQLNKQFTLDLAGHTYTFAEGSVGSPGTETNGFQLLRDNSITIKNGSLNFTDGTTGNFKTGIQNYSNLRLENVVLDGSNLKGPYTLSNNFGNTVISNSKIIAKEGRFAFDLYFWPSGGYTGGVEVKVENSTILGNIELTTDGSQSNRDSDVRHHLTITGSSLQGRIENCGNVTIKGTTISGTSNNAVGAVIYNRPQTAEHASTIVIEDSVIKNNVTTNIDSGGVVVNEGVMFLKGRNYFENNYTHGNLVDIANTGILDISGYLTLHGGIVNAGTLTFSDKTEITTILTSEAIQTGSFPLISGSGTVENWSNATLKDNPIYDIAWADSNDGTITVKVKSAEAIVESLPVTTQQAGTVAAILPTIATGSAPAPVAAIADAISIAAQSGNGDAVAQIAEDLAPSTAPVVSSVSQGVNNAIAGVANARMAANRAAGDVFTGGSAWAQMIYNSADQDATKKTAKLESDTYGITVGIDGKIGDNLTIGAGFGVTKTDAESGTRDIDVDSYALFGYTEYNADNGWFVNGMVNAIRGRYEENKAPAGIKLTAKYQTTVLGAGVATGYHFENGISPEVGLRYLRTHQGSYNDGAQKIHTDGTNLLTASIGAKYEKAFEQGDWVLKPSARVAATYDVVSDDTESAIRVIGGGQYHVISAHQKRAAYEAGIGLEASNGDWDFSVSYNGEFRSHFQSHTGMIKAKYNF